MKVLVVTSSIDPVCGGPTRSCVGLCRALAQEAIEVTLLVLRGNHAFENSYGVRVYYAEDSRGVDFGGMVRQNELVHLQGLWDPRLHAVIRACREVGTPYIISPRGMLDPWAMSVKRWKKVVAMFLYQRADLKSASAIHATAELESQHIRAQGFSQPIVVAPNGVDVPPSFLCVTERGVKGGKRTAIFLSRLHPGKGLLVLAEAWSRVRPQGWKMRVVGPDTCGHKAKVVAKLEALGVRDEWEFVDMVDDVRKWQEYSEAELLVHPSVSENFGITIAEGLYAGLPVICTKGTPWEDLESNACGWRIEQGVEALSEALERATEMTTSGLIEMGSRGRDLIRQKYLWVPAAKKIIQGYESVLRESDSDNQTI